MASTPDRASGTRPTASIKQETVNDTTMANDTVNINILHSEASNEYGWHTGYNDARAESDDYNEEDMHLQGSDGKDSYLAGFEAGKIEGHEQGLIQGRHGGREEGYNEGYRAGHEDGHQAGWYQGHEAGYHQGREAGSNERGKAGYKKGHEAGYQAGYDRGKEDAQTDDSAEALEKFDEGYSVGHRVGLDAGSERSNDGRDSRSIVHTTAQQPNRSTARSNGRATSQLTTSMDRNFSADELAGRSSGVHTRPVLAYRSLNDIDTERPRVQVERGRGAPLVQKTNTRSSTTILQSSAQAGRGRGTPAIPETNTANKRLAPTDFTSIGRGKTPTLSQQPRGGCGRGRGRGRGTD